MELSEQVRFVGMPDGRRIAYREMGCPKERANKSLLLLHGLMSSRRVAMPGVSQDLMEKYGVRLIAIDRPGYGQSDPHHSQSFHSTSKDIEFMIDELDLGEKISLLGFSMGGAYCWGAARHIPDRIASIALVAPAGNFWWRSIPKKEQQAITNLYPFSDRLTSAFFKMAPFPIIELYTQLLSNVILEEDSSGLSLPDRLSLQNGPKIAELFQRDREESLKRNKGFGVAKDFELFNKGWDFDLQDIRREFKGKKIHLWQGDVDTVVPYKLQECVRQAIPDIVHLHKLHNHGHFSWFCFDPNAPSQILEALYGPKNHIIAFNKREEYQDSSLLLK